MGTCEAVSFGRKRAKRMYYYFFIQIDDWINNAVNKNDYFWILGL